MQRLASAVITGCGFGTLAEAEREPVERWLAGPENATRSARTRNSYLNSIKSFLNWCMDTERLITNPLLRIHAADEKVDRRRMPRALNEEELVRLLDAARRRPLVEAQTISRGSRRGKPGAQLRPETRAKLERLGLERALIYKVLTLTGLRIGELSAIRVCDVILDGPRPYIALDAKHEKNRQGSSIPLRADLASDLRAWIGSRRDGPLFAVSQSLVKVLDRDLKFARIAKHDDRGKTVCVHSLRHTFATLLSRGGVAPRVAQAAMRHSTMDLTMRVYTDPRLLDVARALEKLPELPISTRNSHPETRTCARSGGV